MEIRLSGGLRGTGQSLYSLAALSLRFSFASSEPGEAFRLPLHLVMGWIFLSEKLSGETGDSNWRDEPFAFVSSAGSLERGGDRVREAGKRDGTEGAPQRATNWCGTGGDVGERTAVLTCCFP